MNDKQRKALNEIVDKLSALRDELTTIREEEEEYKEAIPENLIESEDFVESDWSIDLINAADSGLDVAIEQIWEIVEGDSQ
jgi:hypothetical protein